MKKVLIVFLMIFSVVNANAQMGDLNRLKNKAKKTRSKKEKKEESNDSQTISNSSVENDREKEKNTAELQSIEHDFKNMMRVVSSFMSSPNVNSTSWMLDYKKFADAKKAYADLNIVSDIVIGRMDTINDYFDNYLPNEFATIKLKKIAKSELVSAFDENIWKVNPQRGIKQIEYVLKDFLQDYYEKSKDSSWINDLTEIILKKKEELIEYRDGDEFKANIENAHKEKISSVFPSKSVLNDASIKATVTKNHSLEGGKIQKIIIASDWIVEKESSMIPVKKYVRIEVVTIKDGACYLNFGTVFRDYEGGGSYGSKKLSFYSDVKEMNCTNY